MSIDLRMDSKRKARRESLLKEELAKCVSTTHLSVLLSLFCSLLSALSLCSVYAWPFAWLSRASHLSKIHTIDAKRATSKLDAQHTN
jgi:hypothetical protein